MQPFNMSSILFSLCLQCFTRAKDLGGLLLLHSSHSDAAGMDQLATLAGEPWARKAGVMSVVVTNWGAGLAGNVGSGVGIGQLATLAGEPVLLSAAGCAGCKAHARRLRCGRDGPAGRAGGC